MPTPDGIDRLFATVARVTSVDRWTPDAQLIPSVLAGSGRKMCELSEADRAWVVAGLTVAGHTAEDIADRLGCSLRLVRSIRAKDMTQVCVAAQAETRTFVDELHLARSEMRSAKQALGECELDLARTREQLNRLIDAHITGTRICGKCGTPMSGYNLYTHGTSGKQFCRECHRRRQADYRERCKVMRQDISPAQIVAVGQLDRDSAEELVAEMPDGQTYVEQAVTAVTVTSSIMTSSAGLPGDVVGIPGRADAVSTGIVDTGLPAEGAKVLAFIRPVARRP